MCVQPWISRLSALVSPDLCEAGLIDADCERDKVVPSSGLSQWLSGKATACSVGDSGNVGSIPVLRRSPGKGNGNPLQYSCLENPMDRGAW